MFIIRVITVLFKQWEDFDRHPLVDQATRLSYLLASFIQPWTSEYRGITCYYLLRLASSGFARKVAMEDFVFYFQPLDWY